MKFLIRKSSAFLCIEKVIITLYFVNDQAKKGIKHDDNKYISKESYRCQ